MFDNIIGNNENKRILENIISNNNVSHSYLFSGISGIGKFLFAKEFAKALLCLDLYQRPCNRCKACNSFENQNNPDIIIIDEQEESIKTEQIKQLTNNVLEKPTQGNKKIYIIRDSENMTREAQNSLLKTLEEPPEYIVIILVANNENLLLNTIKSRCLKIPFKKLSNNEIQEYFDRTLENINVNMINAFDGSISKAVHIMSKSEIYEKINETFCSIEKLNELQILSLKETIFKDKEEIYSILDYINIIFYDKMLQQLTKTKEYEGCIEAIEKAKLRLKKNSNYDMTIDNCLLEIERSLRSNG